MSKELVNKWFNALGSADRDLPLLIVDNYAYTPRMAVNEVNMGSALGDKLQALIERNSFGTTYLDEIAVAKVRLKTRLESSAQDKPLFATLGSQTFTKAQLLAEIDAGTQLGLQWVGSEISRMKMLVSVR